MTSSKSTHPLKKKLGGRNLYLVGMMGSGKSTTGKPLAQKLDYKFIDSDTVIEELTGKSIKQIFEEEGENRFREIEAQVLQNIGQYHSLIVATGGGIVTKNENWGILHQGVVIWLDPDVQTLFNRLQADDGERPLFKSSDPIGTLNLLVKKRRALYSEADLRVVIENQSCKEVIHKILKELDSMLTETAIPDAPRTTAN